ncbi:MAG: hypothetical protein LBR65_01645, partial [Culturomica sp.]|nr:hypothetical protein [Culturomica sp.]
MKQLILATLMTFIALGAVGQGRYYTLQECGNDPLKYIERNYEDNPGRYTGKTLDFFVQECELTLEDFFPDIYHLAEGGTDIRDGKVIGVFFEFYKDIYTYTLCLQFNPPFTYSEDDFFRLENSDETEIWQDKYYQFFKN